MKAVVRADDEEMLLVPQSSDDNALMSEADVISRPGSWLRRSIIVTVSLLVLGLIVGHALAGLDEASELIEEAEDRFGGFNFTPRMPSWMKTRLTPHPAPLLGPAPIAPHHPEGWPVEVQLARGKRLCNGGVNIFYHQTTAEVCPLILSDGFKLGVPGNIGAGIYFAETAERTGVKSRHYGCMIEVAVRLGRVNDMHSNFLYGTDRADRLYGYKLISKGYDSMKFNDPSKEHGGLEYEVYFQDQIVDMIAYPVPDSYHNSGARTGPYLNGKANLEILSTCDPQQFVTESIATK